MNGFFGGWWPHSGADNTGRKRESDVEWWARHCKRAAEDYNNGDLSSRVCPPRDYADALKGEGININHPSIQWMDS